MSALLPQIEGVTYRARPTKNVCAIARKGFAMSSSSFSENALLHLANREPRTVRTMPAEISRRISNSPFDTMILGRRQNETPDVI